MYTRRPYTFDRVVRLIIRVLFVMGALWLVNTLRNVLLPFLVACLVAYLMEPFVQFNRRLLNLKGRIIAIFVTLFEALFFLLIASYFLIPMLFDEMHQAAHVFRAYASSTSTIPFLPEELHEFLRKNVDFNHISDLLTTQEWTNLIDEALTTMWSIITGSISMLLGLFSWCIVFLYVVFIMIDYDRLRIGFHSMIPPKYRDTVLSIGNDIQTSMNHYFRGQALIAFLVGILFSIGFLIVGLPMAVFLGLFIGVLNLVPYLQFISVVPMTLLCLVYAVSGGGDFWTVFWECVAVYAIVQAIQDLFLTPKIMGKVMGLNPALILLSLSIWGSLLGLIGLIIALPLTTLLLAYYEKYIIRSNDENQPP
ncbi:MAG: AI-2E family transporter, partial [Paramuribaculum sp.]|nr:AI-2E family transporter [Paramuribaculum sp.]